MLNGRYDRLGWLPCVCYYYGSPVIVWATSLALIFEFYVITIYVTYANIYIYLKTWIDKHFHNSYDTGLFHFSGLRSLKGG